MNSEPSPDLAFEDALGQVERIVANLEQGTPELATALAQYEQAIRLLAHCQGLIEGAARTIALLTGVDEQGRPLTTPFDATATATAQPDPVDPPRKVSPGSAHPSRLPDRDDSSIPF